MPVAVLVPYERGAASPSDIWRAAAGRWRIVFLYRSSDRHPPEILGILSRFGEAIDLDQLGYDRVVERARRAVVRGVVTFGERMVSLANALARDLDCVANPPGAVLNVTDKSRQRQALNGAGISITRFATVGPGSVAAAVGAVGLPAVLKPRTGGASQGVTLVHDAAAVAAVVARGGDDAWLLEELLVGAPRTGEPWLGDYVSVEILTVGRRHRVLGVTDKLPLAPGFRETGPVLPSGLPQASQEEVSELTARALDALGIENGMSHSEVMLTEHGPRLIEVNGRLGGSIQRLFTRASDANPVALALEAAMGAEPPRGDVGFRAHVATVFVLPPVGAVRVRTLATMPELRKLAGVWHVEELAGPGDRVDAAAGSLSRVQAIDLEAGSRRELADRIRAAAAAAAARAFFD